MTITELLESRGYKFTGRINQWHLAETSAYVSPVVTVEFNGVGLQFFATDVCEWTMKEIQALARELRKCCTY